MNKEQIQIIQTKMRVVGVDSETIAKECSFALQAISKSKQLQDATIESKQSAILNIVQVGLTLNPVMKLAYLVPRWSREGTLCCLEPSYQGLVKLLTDTGSIETINAQLVYENDKFEYLPSDFERPIIHESNPFQNRGQIIGVYAVAKLTSGACQAETMSIEQLHEIRELSESYKAFKAGKVKSCVWVEHEGEMYRKTIIRRIAKYLPKSDKFTKVAAAIDLDEQDFRPSESQKHYARELLEGSDVSEKMEVRHYEFTIENGSIKDLTQVIDELKERQRDSGRYGMNEINKIVENISK
jgi:recombination protein RecT